MSESPLPPPETKTNSTPTLSPGPLCSYVRRSPKLIFALAVLALLLVFNLSREPLESKAQRSYSAWLEDVGNNLREVEVPEVTQIPTLKLTVAHNQEVLNFGFPSPASANLSREQQAARGLRLLEQVREAQIFRLGRAVAPQDLESVRAGLQEESLLEIQAENKSFQLLLPTKQLEADTRAQLLLKLLELYASPDALPEPTLKPRQKRHKNPPPAKE